MRETCVYTTLAIVCGVSVVVAAGIGPRPATDATVLDFDAPHARQLSPGEVHRYQLPLEAAEFARVVVEQRGVDVVVQVRDPDDRDIDEIQEDMRPRGEERVEIVAGEAGTYSLSVVAADGAIEPGSYTIRLDSRRPATTIDRVVQESRSLRTTATRLERAARFDEARSTFERALSLCAAALGPHHPYVGMLLFDLAGNAMERHDDPSAQSMYQQAIAIFDQEWESGDPYAAMARARLAWLRQRAGQSQIAEDMLRPALAVLEASLGPEHPWVLRGLVTLATLRNEAGDLQEAEAITRRGLRALEKTRQTGTMLEAMLLNSLANLSRQKNALEDADRLFRRSLDIAERLQGPDTYFVSTVLQNSGIVARERKDYAAAETSYTRALAIRERIVGANHPDIAGLLNNLANVYHATGDEAKALETHLRALHLWEQAVGPNARVTLLSVGNIAATYQALGDIPTALMFQHRADAILETQMSLALAAGSERQKLAFMRSVAERTDRSISLHLHHAFDSREAASLAALALLQRKGRVQDAMADVFAAVRQRVADADDRVLMDRLNDTTAQLAKLVLDRPTAAGPQSPASIAELEARKEQLESTLSEHSAEFRAQTRPVTLEAVQNAIPDDAALLEFAVFRPFDPTAERNAEAYGPARYAAYVVRKHMAPVGVDLGAVADIDPLIGRFRNALRDPGSQVTAAARALDERIMQPLRASLAGATRLLISPDGDLNLVPFEAFVDSDGLYLIERFATSYLTSGRDLLRMQVSRGVPSRPVIVADPLFGEPPAPSELYFAPLSASATEGRFIKELFPDATLLTGPLATKAALAQVKAPRLLHIASHGFFLKADASAAAAQNPLLRSGLALAGGNVSRRDGILTALEASGLDLWGTKLVTLSACDTGVGEIQNHEGVYGLRRAFVLAGAETLVMTLWPVSDYITREAMVDYYARLRAGAGRGDALRQAKLKLLKRQSRRHPYYWAAFIQSGEWANLDGHR